MGYGSRIRLYREKNRMYQSDLGKALGVTAQAVSKWERDKAEPDMESITKMCEIFGIDANTLLGIQFDADSSKSQEESKPDPLIAQISDMISNLSEENKSAALKYIDFLGNQEKKGAE